MPVENFNPNDIEIKAVTLTKAKELVLAGSYMKTFPSGARIAFGVYYGGQVKGIAVFGKSTSTDTKAKLFKGLKPDEIIEMQRLWISDDLGKNAESKALSKIMKLFRVNTPGIRLVWTYAGGCKHDCGIVYQSSGFIHLGSDECNDFYLTERGEYKNIINVLRFGKAPKEVKGIEAKAKYVYGPGQLLHTRRYYYCFLLDKGLNNKMNFTPKPFPKDSKHFRKDQAWVT